jgi:5-methylcytosine-specific restriction endonuclease McrA
LVNKINHLFKFLSINSEPKRLISENVFERKCYNCKQTTWLEKDIPLELHHIDGDHSNNELSNLTLLCPNCDALTDNYRGKNK